MDTIGQLIRIASKYAITSLKQELSYHIKSTLSLSTALEYFKYASENGLCQKDIQLIRAYILKKNFMALNEQSNGFSNISQQDLLSFIMDDNLGLKEEDLFNLITGWVKNGYPGRASLLKHVRYQYMNADFKKNFVDTMEDVNMKNAMRPFKQQSLAIRRRIALNPRNPNEMVLAIGGWKALNPDGPCQHIEIGANYGVLTQPWKKIKATHNMPVKRAYHGIGLVNNIMYLFGGVQMPGNFKAYPRSTFAFDTIEKVSNMICNGFTNLGHSHTRYIRCSRSAWRWCSASRARPWTRPRANCADARENDWRTSWRRARRRAR